MAQQTIFELLRETGLPAAYGTIRTETDPPFLVYLGAGQERSFADNTIYYRKNTYQIEYYFRKKDSSAEDSLEALFLLNGWIYDKSEDAYIDGQDLYVIYYDVWRKDNV